MVSVERELQLGFGAIALRAGELHVEQARTPGDGQSATAVVADRVSARQFIASAANWTIRVGKLTADEGVRVKRNGEILAAKVILEDVRVEIADVMAVRRPRPEGEPVEAERPRLRWEILDALEGHLNVDLVVDITGPLVGRRDETHHFRVIIENGAIDYERLEGDVHWFERSFLDITVDDGKLALQRNLPLIPFTTKGLLWWPLDEEGLELARAKRVKLRTLLDWEVPGEERERRAGGKRIRLNRIDAQNIDVALALAEPAWLDLGDTGRIQLAPAAEHGPPRAAITGELGYVAGEESRSAKIEAAVGPLQAAVEGLRLGGVRLWAARLSAERLRAELSFTDMRPGVLVVAADRLEAGDVRIIPSGPSGARP